MGCGESSCSDYKHWRLSLIHQTDQECAEKIISTQTMLPGSKGLYGAGIYFANTIEASDLKAHRHGVYLIADVYIGRYKEVTKNEALSKNFDAQKIQDNGYTCIFGYQMPTGREIIVFDPERVRNIKYIYGTKPQAMLTTYRERITLFLVVSKDNASEIVENQKIPKIDGPLGQGYYMFDTITDAKKSSIYGDDKETYLVADVYMKKYLQLNNDNVDDHDFHRSFTGSVDGMTLFILKDPELIKRIHYCGGQPWN